MKQIIVNFQNGTQYDSSTKTRINLKKKIIKEIQRGLL